MQAERLRGSKLFPAYAGAACVVLLAAVLAGCRKDAVTPQGDALNPEAIAGEIRPILAPLKGLLSAPAADNGNFTLVDAEWCRSLADQIKQAKSTHGGTKNGEAALARLADELEDLIQNARAEDRWGLVLCAIDVHEELRPGMHLMRLLRQRAMLHAMRPHVVVKGFFDDNDKGELYVFLQVTLRAGYQPWPEPVPSTEPNDGAEGEGEDAAEAEGGAAAAPAAKEPLDRDEVHMVQVRLNEEFYGLRFVDVIGNKRGIVLEYLVDPGHFFQVLKPAPDFG